MYGIVLIDYHAFYGVKICDIALTKALRSEERYQRHNPFFTKMRSAYVSQQLSPVCTSNCLVQWYGNIKILPRFQILLDWIINGIYENIGRVYVAVVVHIHIENYLNGISLINIGKRLYSETSAPVSIFHYAMVIVECSFVVGFKRIEFYAKIRIITV
jgi:hypothetical protein